MKTRLYALALALLFLSAANAQYAAATSGSTTLNGEVNGKINHQESAGAPGSSYNCTIGKDLYTNTSNGDLYKCTTTGTPGTWTLFGAAGSTGATGPTGPTGPSGAGSGTINSGANSAQLAQYTGSGIVVGPATVSGDATMAAGGALTIAASAITNGKLGALAVDSPKMAVVNTRRTICIPFGTKNAASALVNNDLADSDLYFMPYAATLVEITVRGDAGTPNVILGRDRAGSVVNLTSSALATAASGAVACSNAGGTTGLNGATTCSSTLQNTSLSAGDWILPVSGTAGGTAKQMSACLTMVVN